MQLKVKVRACTQLSHSLVLQGVYVSRTRLRSIKVLSALGTYFINSRVGSMEMVFPKWCISCSTHRERALAVRLIYIAEVTAPIISAHLFQESTDLQFNWK